ncbi:helix-turn-helix domain-containing protein [Deinococcus sp. QL22]|uniref:helix-turn-helix domain-containing protein n=1 Tax=Deinococcus sp. QL22 TaxID=2939437 RepID=UPI0020183318|nr:helix-turn-helix domain-containing protein [Deinococcus sp. QL22]UQN08423.1 helix-turn-helix domain-containing protein [Deinococcus sp. QL22]
MHLAELLKDLVYRLKTGQSISLPPEDEIELHEAAALLRLPPTEVMRLGEIGTLPSRQVGELLLLHREDVLAYQLQQESASDALPENSADYDD